MGYFRNNILIIWSILFSRKLCFWDFILILGIIELFLFVKGKWVIVFVFSILFLYYLILNKIIFLWDY